MTVTFAEGVAEIFDNLPLAIKVKAARLLALLAAHPRMYPVRRRGIMRGHHYLVVGRYLFYYRVSSDAVRISAILPGQMKQA